MPSLTRIRGRPAERKGERAALEDLRKAPDLINAWVKKTGLPAGISPRNLSMSIGENNRPEVLQAYMGE